VFKNGIQVQDLCEKNLIIPYSSSFQPFQNRLVRRFCSASDFYEGVRSVLVDRDNQPSWNPKDLSDVTSDNVDKYFENLPPNEELQF